MEDNAFYIWKRIWYHLEIEFAISLNRLDSQRGQAIMDAFKILFRARYQMEWNECTVNLCESVNTVFDGQFKAEPAPFLHTLYSDDGKGYKN